MTYLLAVSHPDDLWPIQYVIRMTYEASLCHPDDITYFEPKVIRMS